MSNEKLFAGPALRRLRRNHGHTQAKMAELLDISPSYLNLLERNQRALSARLMLALAERFDLDPRSLTAEEPGGGMDALRRRLSDPLFSELQVDKSELEEWMMAAPNTVEAFAKLFDRGVSAIEQGQGAAASPVTLVRREIERWRNHFADLDSRTEELADELRLQNADLYAAISERLRSRHQLMIRILPGSVMPDKLRRFDLHARQLQLSEMLDPASRTFQAAYLLGQLEFSDMVSDLVRGAQFGNRAAERFLQRHLLGYFAAALMMPYGRFLRACEQTGYDIHILQRRFGAGFEQVAHRLTTLQRVGARGLPFFMVRVDRAGQFSKRYAGASNAPLVESASTCPLWHVNHSFAAPSKIQAQLVELEDQSRWLTISRTVQGTGYGAGGAAPEFSIGLGVAAEHAGQMIYARSLDMEHTDAVAIGLGCAACKRSDCAQRSVPPQGRTLKFDDRERGITPFDFVPD
ncbi:helix-turn-helix transcriptional regulator [Sphingorhabdus sp. Alg239-R122]|uniref:helix-turn-helix domain-containing protein n=1 Tax=Sphingorhabdus sp. Alg239-R122 TaxID=2305989 RepID=UPI0013D985DC|nr:helix-turn-helix transcriptional regulator [Sphingorhabdus sp. Alg239-R122]